MAIDKKILNMKIINNEGLLPWDDNYLHYSSEEHLWICNKALELLFNTKEQPND